MTPDEILEQARKQFTRDEEWERELRDEFRGDVRFRAGFQWSDAQLAQRKGCSPERPALVHNRLPTYIANITNECRQNRPSVGFTPIEGGDGETARLLEGMARHIQYDSQASIASETSNEYQVMGSFGFFRMVSQYVGNDTFDQELKIKEIVNPLSVYGVLRPAILRQKCRHAFVIETITREEHERLYGESAAFTSFAEHDTTGWVSTDEVRIAEYWWIETKKKTIARLPDGSVMDLALVPEDVKETVRAQGGELKTRVVDVDTVRWCKMNGAEILPDTETEWVGSTVPIYASLGLQAIVDEKPMLFSLIRFMRSPQQLINYAKSRLAECLMAPAVSGWIGAEGQFENHEREWDEAAVRPRSRMEYKIKDVDGKSVGSPHRDTFEPPIVALSAFLTQEIEELKAISGIFDASLGNRGNETSGRGIQARQQQTERSNMHFGDNHGRAQEACGRDLAEAIPRIYDSTRLVRILGEDEVGKFEWINKEGPDGNIKYDISSGKYDVAVKIGKSYPTKRLETFDLLGQLSQNDPTFMQNFGDIVFQNSDVAGADQIAARYKKMLPPNLAEDDADKKAPVDPKMQAQMQALDQQNQQLIQALNQATQEAEAKSAELASRERIVAVQEETKRAIALAQVSSQEGIELLRQEIAHLSAQVGHAAKAGEAEAQRAHASAEAQSDREHQVSQSDADRAAQADASRASAAPADAAE